MKIFNTQSISQAELRNILQKPAFDAVKLSDKAKAGIKAMFGAELTAAQVVDRIVNAVRKEGDAALFAYTKILDGAELNQSNLEVSEAEFAVAREMVKPAEYDAILLAISNVRKFHAEQKPKSWFMEKEYGAMLGQKVTPLERVGIYVPGGTASYPSSVIMNAVPAKVAGVQEIIMVVPPAKDGSVNPYVLTAAKAAGVDRVFKLGGAQAVAALAFGTETVPKVDKITGPGNLFVTLAKKAVYGYCDIDMLAGPSEILIVADKTADPVYVAADMLSQAEHDMLASSILITDSAELADQVAKEIAGQLAKLTRQEIASASLENNGLILITENIEEALALANISAPEHLEIITEEPFRWLSYVKHAGAVFLGPYSPEPLGDYLAGPNHVLPTGGTARYYSVLNVETFMKKTSVIAYTQEALTEVSDQVITLANVEGLTAHANAIAVRKKI